MAGESLYEKFNKEIIDLMNPQSVMAYLQNKNIINEAQKNKVLECKRVADRNFCLICLLANNAVDEELFLTALQETECDKHVRLLKILRPQSNSQLQDVIDDHEQRLQLIEGQRQDLRTLQEKIDELMEQKEELEKTLKEKEKKLEENSDLIFKLKKRIEELESEKCDLEKQIASAHTKIQDMENDLAAVRNDMNVMRENHQSDMAAMHNEIRLIQRAIRVHPPNRVLPRTRAQSPIRPIRPINPQNRFQPNPPR